MKKLVAAVCTLVLLGSTFAAAEPGFPGKKIKNSKIVQGTTINYEGTTIEVPQGQTVIVGKRDNGYIVLRGLNLENVKINGSSVYTKGYTVLSYDPVSNVAFLNKGEELTVVDRDGHNATVGQGGAISIADARINSNTVKELQDAARAEAQAVVEEGIIDEEDVIPAFVAATTPSQTAVEQAVENVEGTLSHSAPGR